VLELPSKPHEAVEAAEAVVVDPQLVLSIQAPLEGERAVEAGDAGGVENDGGGAPPPGPLPPPPIVLQYCQMLRRLDLNNAAITALEGFGLDSLEAIYDLTEDDIPAIMKELRRTGTIIKQSSQNFLQALQYWIMRQERLQRNYLPNDFTDIIMRVAIQRWKNSKLKTYEDLVKEPEDFKQNTKWREFNEAFTTFL
jgi:hypothetical protein